jgi:hypothetical protein
MGPITAAYNFPANDEWRASRAAFFIRPEMCDCHSIEDAYKLAFLKLPAGKKTPPGSNKLYLACSVRPLETSPGATDAPPSDIAQEN